MAGHLLSVLEPSVVLQVNGNTGSPPGVTSDRGQKTRGLGPLPNRSPKLPISFKRTIKVTNSEQETVTITGQSNTLKGFKGPYT